MDKIEYSADVLLGLGDDILHLFSQDDDIHISTDHFSFDVASVEFKDNTLRLIDAEGTIYKLCHCKNPSVWLTKDTFNKYIPVVVERKEALRRKCEQDIIDQRILEAEMEAEWEAEWEAIEESYEQTEAARKKRAAILQHRKDVKYLDDYSLSTLISIV